VKFVSWWLMGDLLSPEVGSVRVTTSPGRQAKACGGLNLRHWQEYITVVRRKSLVSFKRPDAKEAPRLSSRREAGVAAPFTTGHRPASDQT
jgi:hypothetical protein